MADNHPIFTTPGIETRFWSLVEKRSPAECWPWNGPIIKKDGRGIFSGGGLHQTAPRIALGIKLGRPVAPGLFACHSCDNPNCVNPDHLWEGSNKDNLRDASAKGRVYGQQKTHCKRGHPLSGGNVYRTGYKARGCMLCQRMHRRKYRLRIKAEREAKAQMENG